MLDRVSLSRGSVAIKTVRPFVILGNMLTISGAVASLLVTLLYFDVSLTILVLFALIPVFELLAVPATLGRRRQTATFVLVIAAAALSGWTAALAVGLTGMVIEQRINPTTSQRSLIAQPLVFAGLIGVGALADAIHWLPLFLKLLWIPALGFWFIDRARSARLAEAAPALVALAWLSALISVPLWKSALPTGSQDLVGGVLAGLAVAVGFMTADSLFGSVLGIRHNGFSGLRFWRLELIPTFARYNLMAATGALLGGLLLVSSAASLTAAFAGLGVVLLILAVRYDRERAHRRLIATICALSSALDARDPYTRSHSDRVAAYSIGIAKHAGWKSRQLRELELAAHLHDVGKIGIPDSVLQKPGKLTSDEFAVIQSHVEQSASIILNIPELRQVSEIISQHHERLDGSGYPRGLAGDEISPAGRILGVADSFDAMTSNRSYRSAMPALKAITLIASECDTKYDRTFADALSQLAMNDEVEGALVYTYCLSH